MTKKIAIDSGPLASGDSVRGIGTYTRELLNVLNIKGVDVSKEYLSKYDIVHFTKFNPFFVYLPFLKPKNTKFVLTIYDLIPLIYPSHYRPGLKGNIKLLLNKYLIKKNVDAIITISETSKKDICRFLGIIPKKVHVVHLGAGSKYMPIVDKKKLIQVTKKYNLPKSFIFYFGDINYNKNIPILVDACKSLNLKLVIGGKQAKEIEQMDLSHSENAHLKNIYKDLINNNQTLRLGYVSDEDANAIYNLAEVCVQPSLYEGFGLSVANAMAAGCPVIAARTQALIEIGEGAVLFFNPREFEDLALKIKQVINNIDIKKDLIKNGFERVKEFTWKKTADNTQKVYEEL